MQKLFLSLLLILSGCGMNLDGEGDGDPQVAVFEKADLKDVSFEIIPLEEAQSYAVELTWPKTTQKFYVKRETDQEFQIVPPTEKRTRIEAKGGELLILNIEMQDQDEVVSQRTLEIEIPLDVVINSTVILTENRTLNCERLFLGKLATLRLQNFKLEINCKELISDNATIETFPEKTRASTPAIDDTPQGNNIGGNGRSGANSVFYFEQVRGALTVNLRGESGAHGRNGVHSLDTINRGWQLGCRGQNAGHGGNTGNLTIITPNAHRLQLVKHLSPGAPGTPGHPNARWEDKEAIGGISTYKPGFGLCIRTNKHGAAGKSGVSGSICLKESETSDCL